MMSITDSIKLERDKLIYNIVNRYGNNYHITIEDINKLCPFIAANWNEENEIQNISIKKPIRPNIDELDDNNICQARVWNEDDNNIRCSKKKQFGDYCSIHSKEVNKKCKKCSKYYKKDIIHSYRWEICGNINEEPTYCYWKGKQNKVKNLPTRKTGWSIFCKESRNKIKKEPGEDIRKKMGELWRNLTDDEKKQYELKAKST